MTKKSNNNKKITDVSGNKNIKLLIKEKRKKHIKKNEAWLKNLKKKHITFKDPSNCEIDISFNAPIFFKFKNPWINNPLLKDINDISNNNNKIKIMKKKDFNRILMNLDNKSNPRVKSHRIIKLKGSDKDNLFKNLFLSDNNFNDVFGDKFIKSLQDRKKLSKLPPPIKKKHIDIRVKLNTIQDILNLIDKFKDVKTTSYNINMKALHNIKTPLTQLNNMIGMNTLKDSIVDQILFFLQDMHKNKKKENNDYMHTVIYGPPGTGKTECAKLIGKIYSRLGILKKGKFRKVTRHDLIAGYLGQTAIQTNKVVKECLGGVLFIDEAYALGNPEKRDSFAKECIDTLCEALSNHKSKLMVIIAGYEHELKKCFFSYNQGLESRFTWRFKTDDYNSHELRLIFEKKISDISWKLEKGLTDDWFKEHKDFFTFYGRDIETLLAKTKIAHSKRVFCLSDKKKKRITLEDINNGFDMWMKNDNVKSRKNGNDMKDMYKYMFA